MRSKSRPIFAIFEGGGAKGIANVGAYAAAGEMGLDFVGVAGASAGSIVAALQKAEEVRQRMRSKLSELVAQRHADPQAGRYRTTIPAVPSNVESVTDIQLPNVPSEFTGQDRSMLE